MKSSHKDFTLSSDGLEKLAFYIVTTVRAQKDHFKSVFRHGFNLIRSLRSGFLDEPKLYLSLN